MMLSLFSRQMSGKSMNAREFHKLGLGTKWKSSLFNKTRDEAWDGGVERGIFEIVLGAEIFIRFSTCLSGAINRA